jgi:hypothetical protein
MLDRAEAKNQKRLFLYQLAAPTAWAEEANSETNEDGDMTDDTSVSAPTPPLLVDLAPPTPSPSPPTPSPPPLTPSPPPPPSSPSPSPPEPSTSLSNLPDVVRNLVKRKAEDTLTTEASRDNVSKKRKTEATTQKPRSMPKSKVKTKVIAREIEKAREILKDAPKTYEVKRGSSRLFDLDSDLEPDFAPKRTSTRVRRLSGEMSRRTVRIKVARMYPPPDAVSSMISKELKVVKWVIEKPTSSSRRNSSPQHCLADLSDSSCSALISSSDARDSDSLLSSEGQNDTPVTKWRKRRRIAAAMASSSSSSDDDDESESQLSLRRKNESSSGTAKNKSVSACGGKPMSKLNFSQHEEVIEIGDSDSEYYHSSQANMSSVKQEEEAADGEVEIREIKEEEEEHEEEKIDSKLGLLRKNSLTFFIVFFEKHGSTNYFQEEGGYETQTLVHSLIRRLNFGTFPQILCAELF